MKTGDTVFLNIAETHEKLPKIQHSVAGPFRVLQVEGRTVAIQRGDIVERVSADRVVLAPRHLPVPETDLYEATPADLADKLTSGPTWLFKELKEHRTTSDGSLEFRVRWDRPEDDTWEPRENLPEEAISRYFARYRARIRQRASQIIILPAL